MTTPSRFFLYTQLYRCDTLFFMEVFDTGARRLQEEAARNPVVLHSKLLIVISAHFGVLPEQVPKILEPYIKKGTLSIRDSRVYVTGEPIPELPNNSSPVRPRRPAKQAPRLSGQVGLGQFADEDIRDYLRIHKTIKGVRIG